MNKTPEQIMSVTFTLLVKLGIFILEEVTGAVEKGFDSIYELVSEKYYELVREGKIIHSEDNE